MYRYKQSEVEEMKKDILAQCEMEKRWTGKFNAWRLRFLLEGSMHISNSRKYARLQRQLYLYKSLTKNNQPAW